MYDVNPLGPMMHLKQIEREALALRATTMNSRPRILPTGQAWVVKLLKRANSSFRVLSSGGGGPNIGRSP